MQHRLMKTLLQLYLSEQHIMLLTTGLIALLAYPGGDVPENVGVCTDVIIRSYRKLGIDLQKARA